MTITGTGRRVVTAGEAMSTPPLTIRPDASVWDAWHSMTRNGVRHLLVTRHGDCVGVVDDRAIFAQLPLGPTALHRKPVAFVMCAPVSCVHVESPLSCAAALMLRDGIDAIPVVDEDGVTVGVVTCSDIVAAVARSDDDRADH